MTFNPWYSVYDFHKAFDQPIGDEDNPSLNFDRLPLRMNLIIEEFLELFAVVYGEDAAASIGAKIDDKVTYRHHFGSLGTDVVAFAKESADLIYVLYGTAIEAGIPLDVVVSEVHASNMTKLGSAGRPYLREDGKVLKGPHYEEPHIAKVLGLEGRN